ncbi:ankyrin repeat domain-containing protein 66 [Pseudochaenichthys georgianus]|uniref:ankyrin repeat domain-containing protein 66 n=1 Tax=Pseudochaenichthys georgianus TaxID=52239 RepID=UPI00146F61A9|nr:ankyrin repeat domain-containing protein 66 [Pseudochaenichthys georgianus]
MTELHEAAAAGDLLQVQEILRLNGCDPNQKDEEWSCKTPLHWAAAGGHVEVVRLLIGHGACPSLMTEHGWTAAHSAAEVPGRLPCPELLQRPERTLHPGRTYAERRLKRIAQIYGHPTAVRFLRSELRGRITVDFRMAEVEAQKGISLDDTNEVRSEQENEEKRSKKLT